MLNSVQHTLFSRNIYLIGFLSVRISNKNAFFDTQLTFVPIGQVIIYICLTAQCMKVGDIEFCLIATLIGSTKALNASSLDFKNQTQSH